MPIEANLYGQARKIPAGRDKSPWASIAGIIQNNHTVGGKPNSSKIIFKRGNNEKNTSNHQSRSTGH